MKGVETMLLSLLQDFYKDQLVVLGPTAQKSISSFPHLLIETAL